MEELRCCRCCLASDVKLYDIFTYQLGTTYQEVVGYCASSQITDGLPQFLCSFCMRLIQKFSHFRSRCHAAERLLLTEKYNSQMVTKDKLQNLQKTFGNMHPYAVTHIAIKEESYEANTNPSGRRCASFHIVYDDVKTEANSDDDDESLASVARKRRKKNGGAKSKHKNAKIEDEKEMVVIKGESNEMASLFDNTDFCYEDYNDGLYFAEQERGEGDVKPLVALGNVKLSVEEEFGGEIDVVELSLEEQIAEVQARQCSQNYLNSTFKCKYCYKGFMVDSAFDNHMERHEPSWGLHECGVCHLRFPHKHTLHTHAANAHARNYVCRRCGHVAKAKVKAKEHYRWHQGFLYPCEICAATFSKRTSLLTHLRLSHPSQQLCDICALCFVSAHGLAMHRKKAHRLTSKAARDLQCGHCKMQFLNSEALAAHTSLARDGVCDPDSRPCRVCGAGCAGAEELKQHVQAHRAADTVACAQCGKAFSSRRNMAMHVNRVHGRGGGGGGGGARGALPPAVCEVCGRRCKTRASLAAHQRTHSGEKPFQCALCPKRFSVMQRLQYHARTHSGERPCQCAHCPKAFRHKAALNRHLRVHTGAKPYACAHCSKAFSQSNTLKGHIRTVHLKLPALYRRPAPDATD